MELGEAPSAATSPSERLRAAREEMRLTQLQFGRLLDPPVTAQSVSAWETGLNRPSLYYAAQIQRMTGVKAISWAGAPAAAQLRLPIVKRAATAPSGHQRGHACD